MRWPAAIALALAFSPCKYANKEVGQPHPKPPPITDRMSQQQAVARIERVESGSVTLERAGKPLRIDVSEHTLVYVDGRVAPPQVLQVGMRVRVSYDAIQSRPRANWIQVLDR